MAMDVLFRVPADVVDELYKDLAVDVALRPKTYLTAAATGGGDMVTVLVELAPPTLAALTAIVTAWIRRPGSSAEIDGQKITGISRSVADQLAKKIAEAKYTDPKP